jgi:thiamine kinase-like enzyme
MAATEETVRDLERRIRESSKLDWSAAEDPEEDAEDVQEQEEIHQDTHNTRYELSDFLQERSQVFSIFSRFIGIPEELKKRHALKVALGRKEYNHFYKQMVSAAIKSAHERGMINSETLRKCSDMICADWRSIPVYETSLEMRTRNTKLNKKLDNEGGLYKVEIFLPDGTRLTHFVKRYAKRELFDKAAPMQEYLSRLQQTKPATKDSAFGSHTQREPLGLVARPQYVDRHNLLVAEEFFDGKTLKEELEEHPDQKMTLLKEAIYNWALLSAEATKTVRDKDHYPQPPKDNRGKSLLAEINFRRSFAERFLAQGKEFEGMKKKKAAERIRQDDDLSRLVELYNTEIAGQLDSAEKTVVHGDFHLNNIIFTQEGVRFIDWESPNWTVPHYDIYKLLRYVEVTPEEEKELVMHAFETTHIRREEGDLFWQNYLRCRIHLDLDSAAHQVDNARGGKQNNKKARDRDSNRTRPWRSRWDVFSNERMRGMARREGHTRKRQIPRDEQPKA